MLIAVAVCSIATESKELATDSPSSGDVAAWVDARVEKLAPTAEEKRFDQIGWSTRIVDAATLARKHGRPLFLFTHDGRMNEGRC